MECSLPGSSVHGISQARILEWVVISFSRESSHPGIEPISLMFPVLEGRFFTTEQPGKPNMSLQSSIRNSCVMDKGVDFGMNAWVGIQALPLISGVTLSRFLNLSVSGNLA